MMEFGSEIEALTFPKFSLFSRCEVADFFFKATWNIFELLSFFTLMHQLHIFVFVINLNAQMCAYRLK